MALVDSGGYAEYATAPAQLAFPIPDSLDGGTALALLIQGLTAWHLYRTAANVAEGESVVVHSAAGGVGSLAVQLAPAFGVGRLIATASSAEKRTLAMELGADVAVDVEVERALAQGLLAVLLLKPLDGVEEIAPGFAGRSFERQVAGASHTGGINAKPREYERRVIAFFDQALLGADASAIASECPRLTRRHPARESDSGNLPSEEVLDEAWRLCSSQNSRAPEMFGTDLGDRLRDARAMGVRR